MLNGMITDNTSEKSKSIQMKQEGRERKMLFIKAKCFPPPPPFISAKTPRIALQSLIDKTGFGLRPPEVSHYDAAQCIHVKLVVLLLGLHLVWWIVSLSISITRLCRFLLYKDVPGIMPFLVNSLRAGERVKKHFERQWH